MNHSTIGRIVLSAAVLATLIAMGTGEMPAALAGKPSGDGGRAFTVCMRAKGLPDFPDVSFSSDGLVNLTIRGERVDVLSPKYGAAVAACQSLLPAGPRRPGAPVAPE
ncbi:hypothetical protein JOL79_24110 [Microbispora sp. RL4-1S]|uniref:Uncharacterized protein n=1 Tax=Microbispora oryzae TaxID=2806554 RepID=A0A940WP00_9ACTN|nr:hypothetical protein [Microbispora oryzae]MBP2706897.1 hypothetical protein [Microbispora oryzae]